MKLEHYSPHKNLKEINPNAAGSGVDARARRTLGHSFFYRAGTTPEEIVTGPAKSKYTVELQPHHKLYDLATDSDKVIANTVAANHGALNMDLVHENLKGSGYHGFYNSNHPSLSHVVALYHASPVSEESDLGKATTNPLKALGIAAGLAGSVLNPTNEVRPPEAPKTMAAPDAAALKHKALFAISQVESGGGKNTQHKPVNNAFHGGSSAYGKYGLMPITIQEVVKKNPDLKHYSGVLSLKGNQVHDFMRKHPDLERKVASRYFDHLHNLSGGDLHQTIFSWNQGPSRGVRAKNKGAKFDSHWYVSRVNDAMKQIKDPQE